MVIRSSAKSCPSSFHSVLVAQTSLNEGQLHQKIAGRSAGQVPVRLALRLHLSGHTFDVSLSPTAVDCPHDDTIETLTVK